MSEAPIPGSGAEGIATTTVVPVSALPALLRAARPRTTLLGWKKDLFPEALARHGRALEVLDPSGDVLPALLVFLQRRGIDLARSRHEEAARAITSARGSTYLILGEEHLPHAAKLAEALHSPAELAAVHDELSGGSSDQQLGERMRDALGVLRRALEAVTPGNVVLVAML